MARRHRGASARTATVSQRSWLDRSARWLFPAIVVVTTFLVFLPGLRGEFVTWDDDRNFLMNEAYRGLGAEQLRWMWTTFHLGPYQPLSWMSLGLDYVLYSMQPFGYHVTSLVIHVVNAWLVYVLARRLFRYVGYDRYDRYDGYDRYAAGVAALLFAIHPLRVESVSWVTERRDVLSGLFAILTLMAYVKMSDLKRRGEHAWRWLAIAVGLFACSLLAKATAMAFAAALLVIDVWLLRRRQAATSNPYPMSLRALLIEKIPFAALGIGAAIVAAIGQGTMESLAAMDQRGPLQRIARGFYGLAFYLWKSIWPVDLSNLYEVPFRANPFDWHFVAAALVVIAITIAVIAVRQKQPAWLVAWASYVALVLPVSGVAHGGGQIVADRYSYLPSLALALLAGAGIHAVWRTAREGRMTAAANRIIATATVATLIALTALTVIQTRVWHDSVTLWRHAFALHQLERLRAAGPAREAEVRAYEATLAQLGNLSAYWAISYNLGVALRASGQHAEAVQVFARGSVVNPSNTDLRNSLAASLIDLRRYDEAQRILDDVIRVEPGHAKAHFNLAIVHAAQGRTDEAIASYRRSISFDASSPDAHYNLGVLLALSDAGLPEAEAEYRKAIALKPEYAEAYNNLGVALGRQQRYAEAIEAFRKSLAINPANPGAEKNLAQAVAIAKGRQ